MIIQRQDCDLHTHYVIITEDGVGSVQFRVLKTYNNQLKCTLSSIWVDPAHRNQGIGAALLEAAENLTLKERCGEVLLYIASWQQQSMREWFCRRGYKQDTYDKKMFNKKLHQ